MGLRILCGLLATALMAVSASCLLKYMWWAACYSAWNGIPKLAHQWQQAGVHASLNGWSFIVMETATVIMLGSVMRLRSLSGFTRNLIRFGASLVLAAVGTATFALVLSLTQIGVR